MLLVESCQSMANLAEAVCWDESRDSTTAALAGLPYVHVDIVDDSGLSVATTASVLEAHRLNSPYILQGVIGKQTFEQIFLEEAGYKTGHPVDRARFLRTVFKFDPATLLHGLFLSYVEDARMRLARAMSSFIEAKDVRVAQSGGVKNDRVNPSGATAEGFGNVPFARTEFTAGSITAFFNLDLRQIRGYGLPPEATELLQVLALYKFVRLIDEGLRRRTACDLRTDELVVVAPAGFGLSSVAELEPALARTIKACGPLFATPPVTRLTFTHTASSAKASKKAAKAAKGAA
jgi:CRISPR-associated protein Csb1